MRYVIQAFSYNYGTHPSLFSRTVRHRKSPHSRSHRPLRGCRYSFTVSNSGLHYFRVAGLFSEFHFQPKTEHFLPVTLNSGRRPWPMTLTYEMTS